MPRLQPTSLPPLQGRTDPPGPGYPDGYDGRYRVYTVDHLPFGVMPNRYLVSLNRDDRVHVGPGHSEREAYEAKRSGYMVFERDAAALGLPTCPAGGQP